MTRQQAQASFVADLARSGLTLKDVGKGWELVAGSELAAMFPKAGVEWAYKIPYAQKHRPGCAPLVRYRVLSYTPLPFDAIREEAPKYLQPPKTASGVFFYAGHLWEPALDPNTKAELIIVEGEKKATKGCLAGFNVIGIGGVWAWRSKSQGIALLPELAAIDWGGRHVYLCFDSDTVTNPDVALALSHFAKTLTALGAFVHVATIPTSDPKKKVGLDDYLVENSPEAFRAHLDEHMDVGDAARVLLDFNAKYAVIISPPAILDEARMDHKDRPIQQLHSVGNFHSLVVPHHIVNTACGVDARGEAKMKMMGAGEVWLKSPMHREYSALTYAPGEARVLNGGSRYNKWMGLGVEPKKGDVGPFLKLMDYFFKCEDPAYKNWLIRWFGYPLKNLGVKMNSAVGIWSVHGGTGKSMLGDKTFGPIYGVNYSSVAQKTMEGPFNGWCAEKQFIMVDELSASDARDRADLFKKMVTQAEIWCNTKHIAEYAIPARENFYLTSNSPKAFYVSDDDRRLFIWEIKGDALPISFYNHYIDTWVGWDKKSGTAKGAGLPALLHYFQHGLDYGDFDPMAPPPVTDAKLAMAAINRHPAEHWLRTFTESDLWSRRGKREVWTPAELCALYQNEGARGADAMSINGFGAHISSARLPRWRGTTTNGKAIRLVAVTNFKKWEKANPKQWLTEFERTAALQKPSKI